MFKKEKTVFRLNQNKKCGRNNLAWPHKRGTRKKVMFITTLHDFFLIFKKIPWRLSIDAKDDSWSWLIWGEFAAWHMICTSAFLNKLSPVRKSKTVLDSGFHAVHSRFFVSGTWVPHPVVSGIPDSTSKNFPDSTTWGENRNTRLSVP